MNVVVQAEGIKISINLINIFYNFYTNFWIIISFLLLFHAYAFRPATGSSSCHRSIVSLFPFLLVSRIFPRDHSFNKSFPIFLDYCLYANSSCTILFTNYILFSAVPALLHGCESWTMRKSDWNKIQACLLYTSRCV